MSDNHEHDELDEELDDERTTSEDIEIDQAGEVPVAIDDEGDEA